VTQGRGFYGPGSDYGALAGHDATRALGTLNIELVSDKEDNHEGMTEAELQDAEDWAERLSGIPYVIILCHAS
jgi:hypothetical protein